VTGICALAASSLTLPSLALVLLSSSSAGLSLESELRCLGRRHDRYPVTLDAVKRSDVFKRIDLKSALDASGCQHCPRPIFGASVPQEVRDTVAKMQDFIPRTVKVHDEATVAPPVNPVAAGAIVTAACTREVRVDYASVKRLLTQSDMFDSDLIDVREVLNILHPVRRYTPPWSRCFAVVAKTKIEAGTFLYAYSGKWEMKRNGQKTTTRKLDQTDVTMNGSTSPIVPPPTTPAAANPASTPAASSADRDACPYCGLHLDPRSRYRHKPFCDQNPANMPAAHHVTPAVAPAAASSSAASASPVEVDADDDANGDVNVDTAAAANSPEESSSAYLYSATSSAIRVQIPHFRLPAQFDPVDGCADDGAELVLDAERYGNIGRFTNDIRWRDSDQLRNIDSCFIVHRGMLFLAMYATRTIHQHMQFRPKRKPYPQHVKEEVRSQHTRTVARHCFL
jgi:hypothetical protein